VSYGFNMAFVLLSYINCLKNRCFCLAVQFDGGIFSVSVLSVLFGNDFFVAV